MLVGPALVEGVEKTNIIVVDLQPQQDLYTIDVDKGRNCYNCEDFGHIVRYYRN